MVASFSMHVFTVEVSLWWNTVFATVCQIRSVNLANIQEKQGKLNLPLPRHLLQLISSSSFLVKVLSNKSKLYKSV